MRSLLTDYRGRWRQCSHAGQVRWTNPQRSLFESPYRLTVFWGANGIGKSLALAELARRAMAGELYWQRPGPRTVILAGKTWSQLGTTIRYLWDLVDPRWFRETIRYEAGGLKGQRLQVYDIVGGPGSSGELRLGTFNAENLAGPRGEVVITDEPLPEDVHNELWPRIFGRQGRMFEGFTPTMGTAFDLGYLWEIVDDPARPWAGQIQVELDLDAVTPRGGLYEIPWATGQEIKEFEEGLSAVQRDMRMGRCRIPKTTEAYYSAWGPHLVLTEPPAWFVKACGAGAGRTPRIGIGIDHGSKPGAQRAVLSCAWGTGSHTRIWVPDEYKADGRTEAADDARGILEMLRRNGYAIEDVDQWVGDRAHAGDWRGGKKSNFRLQQAIAEATGLDTRTRGWIEKLPAALRHIAIPAKRDRSVYEGADIIHRAMLRGPEWYAVSARCHDLDEDHRTWRGTKNEPAKDGCDAERYIVVPQLEGRRY